MAELAVSDGMPPPSGLPGGQCVITRLEDGRLRIDQADPRVLISAEVLTMTCAFPGPGVTVSAPQPGANGTPSWLGAVLRVEGVNRTVVYRIVRYVPEVNGYVGQWPD